jgi:hypothetical protein
MTAFILETPGCAPVYTGRPDRRTLGSEAIVRAFLPQSSKVGFVDVAGMAGDGAA